MKRFLLIGTAIVVVFAGLGIAWPILNEFCILFLLSRIERLGETHLPDARLENGDIVYRRMKADDFPFSPATRIARPAASSRLWRF